MKRSCSKVDKILKKTNQTKYFSLLQDNRFIYNLLIMSNEILIQDVVPNNIRIDNEAY
jgi:hypothetical protein